MTIPAPPLPEIGSLLSACFPRTFREADWTLNRDTHRAVTYRLGRYALAAAVDAVMLAAGTLRLTLFVPDYICTEALERIRGLPVDVHFYAVDENLTPNWQELEKAIAGSERPAAFLLVHYFGFLNDSASASAFCHRHDIFLIEDAAHLLRPTDQNLAADALVFSAHKLFPVPSCAVLVLNRRLHGYLRPTGRSSFVRFETLRWLAKRLIQKVMVGTGLSWHGRWRDDGGRSDPRPTSEEVGADRYSRSLLSVTIMDADNAAKLRRRNYLDLLAQLPVGRGVRPIFAQLAAHDCPYVLPLCTSKTTAENLSVALIRRGVPALRWPELPPEVLQVPEAHATARSLFDQIVLLPVHQSLRPKDISMMARRVTEVVETLGSD
jgi:hypothetical protein